MNCEEAMDYIHGTLHFGSKLGLESIGRLLELLDHPHKKLRYVHVAGTNGKGSTVAFIGSMLQEAGYKVGVYTSPYLLRFTERIRVNGEEITPEALAQLTTRVSRQTTRMVEEGWEHPTEFEIITAIAFLYFAECGCDFVVLEVGLGGRFDATNIIDTPEVAVITTISYDHMNILGDTLEKIAYEKAGIIKPGGKVVLYPQLAEEERVIEEACRQRNAELHKVEFDSLHIHRYGTEGQSFDYGAFTWLDIGLLGFHQTRNAAVALEAVMLLQENGFEIGEGAIRRGLQKACWPGRFEVVSREPLVLIDGAHNAEGAMVLAENLRQYFPDHKITFVFGVLRDKDYKEIVEYIAPLAHGFVAVTPANERALPKEELAIFLSGYCKNVSLGDTIEAAVTSALQNVSENDLICAFGSLYYIGEVRKMFL